ncbi:hypothetical protein EYC80_003852 [Monilinia laxa]|uniref:Uncharacterized protein n=1 Tax=Monilinia laxa TaxID=61186 RepID=A0A5N6KLA4_MONLA|nr:hypothetical protein EYC80_003852 [Monilinia laxa]
MSSKEKEKHGRSESGRRNTLQRMLDLENKNKLQRMQTSTTSVGQPQRNTFFREKRSSNPSPPERPAPIRPSDRAMTAPILSVATPSPQSPEKPKSKAKTSKNVVLVEPVKEMSPEVNADPDDSDASSICRSPAWDGGDGRQRRMAKKEAQDMRKKEEERLKKEKEKAEKDTRAAAQKQNGRLSKAPPSNKRLGKTVPVVPIGRAKPEPAVQIAPEIAQQSPTPDDGRRSRRTSLDLGIKKFMSSFRSRSRSSSVSASGTPQNQSTSNSPTSSGFIGGVKLQQSNEIPAQNESREGKSSNNRTGGHSSKPSQSRPPISLDNSRYRSLDLFGSPGMGAPVVDLAKKPQSEDPYSPLKSPQPEVSKQPSSDLEPIMSKNIRNRKPSGKLRLDENTEPMVNKKSKTKPQSQAAPPSPGFRFGLEKTEPPTQEIQEPFYFQNFDTLPEAVSPENDEYFPKQKRHGKERDLSSSLHDLKLDASPKIEIMKRTPSIHNGHGRIKSTYGAMGNATEIDTQTAEDEENFRAFLEGEYIPPIFKLTAQTSQSSIQPEEGMFSRRELQAPSFIPSPLSPRPNEFQDTSTIASPRHSNPVNSPSLQNSHLDEPPKRLRPYSTLSPRANGFDSRSALPSQSGRRVSEPDYLSPTTLPTPEFHLSPPKNLRPQTANAALSRKPRKDRRSSSRSFTGSSEEYLSFDEQSNITTPAVSRPHSQKGPISSSYDTGASQYHKLQDDWNQTPLPLRLRSKDVSTPTSTGQTTPTGQATPTVQSTNPHESLASADPNTEAGIANLQRRLSLSKSSSTTALHNPLNFLPELKHQPLRPRQGHNKRQSSEEKNVKKSGIANGNGNGNGNGGKIRRESVSASSYSQFNDSKNSALPSGGESSNSNGNSSSSEKEINNDSSEYLRSARLAIPPKKALRSSSAHPNPASSAQSLHSNGQGGIEPMAKMFVICCGCKYFHDMPSKLYECMAKPEAVVKDEGLGVSGMISTRVSCPWCGHGMSTRCCEGWAAVHRAGWHVMTWYDMAGGLNGFGMGICHGSIAWMGRWRWGFLMGVVGGDVAVVVCWGGGVERWMRMN